MRCHVRDCKNYNGDHGCGLMGNGPTVVPDVYPCGAVCEQQDRTGDLSRYDQ